MTTISLSIADTNDDGRELHTTAAWDPLNIQLSSAADAFNGGLRFVGVTVPAGRIVQHARLGLYVVGTGNSPQFRIHGVAEDSAAPFSNLSLPTGRPLTSRYQDVPAPAFGPALYDVTEIVAEITNSPGWSGGSNLAFVIEMLNAPPGQLAIGDVSLGYPAASLEITYADPDPAAGPFNALYAAMTVKPSPLRRLYIKRLIRSLIQVGVWDKLDLLYVMSAHDAQAARLNWKAPGTATLTAVNSPAFTVDQGFTGNGTSAYLSTGVAANALPTATVGDAHMGVWVTADATDDTSGLVGTLSGNRFRILHASTNFNVRLADPTSSSGSGVFPSLGHKVVTRLGSSRQAYLDGVLKADQTIAPDEALPIDVLGFLMHNTNAYSGRRVGAGHFGRNLTNSEQSALRSALNSYLTQSPAIVLRRKPRHTEWLGRTGT